MLFFLTCNFDVTICFTEKTRGIRISSIHDCSGDVHCSLYCTRNSFTLPAQVLDLLDRMKLPQYKETFEREVITGKLLLACDEKVLENELGVKSRLHQMRLMELINGKSSLNELGFSIQSS